MQLQKPEQRQKGLLKQRKHPSPSQRERHSVGPQTRIDSNTAKITKTNACEGALDINCFIASFSGSKSELKALIEQEVREQVRLVSGKCDQRMKEIADQHQTASLSLPQGQK